MCNLEKKTFFFHLTSYSPSYWRNHSMNLSQKPWKSVIYFLLAQLPLSSLAHLSRDSTSTPINNQESAPQKCSKANQMEIFPQSRFD